MRELRWVDEVWFMSSRRVVYLVNGYERSTREFGQKVHDSHRNLVLSGTRRGRWERIVVSRN